MDYITEKSEFVEDNIPLLKTDTPVKGYDGTDIGPANMQAQVLANRTRWLKEEKQDALVSGENLNTVFGVPLEEVKEGGITLADAKDFLRALKNHLRVADGLTLSDDGQSVVLSSTATSGSVSMNIRKVTTERSNTLVELKARQRPGFECRAYAFRATSVTAQPTTQISFSSHLDDRYTSAWGGEKTARININKDDKEYLRWSALNTATLDESTYPDTRLAFSTNGEDWYVFNTDTYRFDDIGTLKLDQESADKLVQKGNTVQTFNQSVSTLLGGFMGSQILAPQLNIAFAAVVDSATEDFIPQSLTVSFNASTAWALQPVSDVPVTITTDTIIFIPRQSGDYIFCFAY